MESDATYRLFIDMGSIQSLHGLGSFLARKVYAAPQSMSGGKVSYTAAETHGVVNCQEETLAFAGVTLYDANGKQVGDSQLPPASWKFFDPPLGSGGNQEIEVVCASLDSRQSGTGGSPY